MVNVIYENGQLSFKYNGGKNDVITAKISFRNKVIWKNSINCKKDSLYQFEKINTISFQKYKDDFAYYQAAYDSIPLQYILKRDTLVLYDTTIYYRIKLKEKENYYAKLLNNDYAKIENYSPMSEVENALKYFVKNEIKLDVIKLKKMTEVLFTINSVSERPYRSLGSTPIYRSLRTHTAMVETNMDYEYFYLLTVRNKSNLDNFRKQESILNNFVSGTKVDAKGKKELLLRIRNIDSTSLLYLVLLGVNSSGEYRAIPIGTAFIDIEPPQLLSGLTGPYAFDKKDGINLDALSFPEINGVFYGSYRSKVFITIGNFEGNNYSGYDVPFTFKASGDFDYIEIQGKRYKTSPFSHHFSKLGTGDNHIKLSLYDRRGNRSEGTLNIATERVKKNEIIIENDIDIYN
ncbi:MAG: hypothetical protein J5I50_05500 [Chitinophagaceae bacterium]|nr:hypothetical protein [Chitinophagaceae bacterium]